MTITVAAVIPAFNAEATLADAIASVLEQTAPPAEIIVVDDGSSDRTAEVGRSFGSGVRVCSIPNGGVSKARNHGVAQAATSHVAFLDADDLWEEGKLEAQQEALAAAPHSRVSTTAAVRVDGNLRHLGPIPASEFDDQCGALLLGSMVSGQVSSGVVERALFDEVGGFHAEFSQCADWDLWLRLSTRTSFAVLSEPYLKYRVTGSNMSNNVALLERDTFAVLDRFFASKEATFYRQLRRRIYANHWIILSGSYNHAGHQRDAVRCGVRAALRHPPSATRIAAAPFRKVARRTASVTTGAR